MTSFFTLFRKMDIKISCTLTYGPRLAAAHEANRLMLLGSPPDMVHSAPSHRARNPHVGMQA